MVDEGCGSCSACSGATTVSAPGGRYDVTTSSSGETGSCGDTSGYEATLTFTLTAMSDVFITTHQAGAVDTVLYVRECDCGGTEVACNDDADGRSTSALQLTLAAGTYNVFVDTAAATGQTIPVDVYVSEPGAAAATRRSSPPGPRA